MKIMAINGSPRKNGNTDNMLINLLAGAASAGAETEMIYLYDLNFRGCTGCMACKAKDNKSPCRCAMRDDLTPVLEKLHSADVVVFGSPVYFGNVSGEMRSFIERFLFQYLNYEDFSKPFSPPKKTAWIFTMNVPASSMGEIGYTGMFAGYENMLKGFFGDCRTLFAADTMQVDDYSRYRLSNFDSDAKRLRHEKVFPGDCRKAYELGWELAQ